MSIKRVARFFGLKKVSALMNFNLTLSLNGKKFKVPIIKNMGLLNLSVKEDWFFALLNALKLSAESSFIDVGVNVGQTLLTFRACYENAYWGFEPNPNCVFYLNTLIKNNEFKETYILPVGLSTNNQLAKFYVKNDSDSAGTMIKDLRPDYYQEEQVNYVPLFSFDNLSLAEIGPISLIKIDVEGAELEVLTGLVETLRNQRPSVICEILDCHSEKSMNAMQSRANQVVDLLHSTDYCIYRIIHEKYGINFEQISEIILKIWTPESWNFNDYLFVPKAKEQPENIKY